MVFPLTWRDSDGPWILVERQETPTSSTQPYLVPSNEAMRARWRKRKRNYLQRGMSKDGGGDSRAQQFWTVHVHTFSQISSSSIWHLPISEAAPFPVQRDSTVSRLSHLP